MLIAIVTISILAITGLTWLLNRILPFKICPICAGVSLTWLWMLAAKFLGYEIDLLILAMLMGGSVVGIAYQIEKKLLARRSLARPAEPWRSGGEGGPDGRSPLLWKTLFIPVGFVAAYGILMQWWSVFLVSIIFLLQIAFIFLSPKKESRGRNQKVGELEEKMKNCC